MKPTAHTGAAEKPSGNTGVQSVVMHEIADDDDDDMLYRCMEAFESGLAGDAVLPPAPAVRAETPKAVVPVAQPPRPQMPLVPSPRPPSRPDARSVLMSAARAQTQTKPLASPAPSPVVKRPAARDGPPAPPAATPRRQFPALPGLASAAPPAARGSTVADDPETLSLSSQHVGDAMGAPGYVNIHEYVCSVLLNARAIH